jgi:hypothetical protein
MILYDLYSLKQQSAAARPEWSSFSFSEKKKAGTEGGNSCPKKFYAVLMDFIAVIA